MCKRDVAVAMYIRHEAQSIMPKLCTLNEVQQENCIIKLAQSVLLSCCNQQHYKLEIGASATKNYMSYLKFYRLTIPFWIDMTYQSGAEQIVNLDLQTEQIQCYHLTLHSEAEFTHFRTSKTTQQSDQRISSQWTGTRKKTRLNKLKYEQVSARLYTTQDTRLA